MTMNPNEANRFNKLYQSHLRLLKLQGKSQKTIDAYSRAVRRVSEHFGCCPDQRFISAGVKATKIALCHYRIWPCRHCVNSGEGIVIHILYSPTQMAILKLSRRQQPIWIKAVHKRPWKQWSKNAGLKKSPYTLPSPQLCHSSSWTRPESSSYSGPARSFQSCNNCTLCSPIGYHGKRQLNGH